MQPEFGFGAMFNYWIPRIVVMAVQFKERRGRK
jgi:hypothetical protein